MTANNKYSLSKPYDLEGEMTPKKMAELDEMLTELYGAASQDEDRIVTIEDEPEVEVEAEDQLLQTLVVPITELQLESANTSPITLVTADAGKVVMPVSVLVIVTVTSVYTSSPTWSLRHNGLAGNLSGTVAPNLQATVTTRGAMMMLTTFTFASDPTGINLVLFLNANPTGTGTATAKAIVTYYLADSITSV